MTESGPSGGFLRMGSEAGREGLQKDTRKLLGLMGIFIILVMVMVSQVDTYVKT